MRIPELARDRTFLKATAVLVGTMVGVGIFGIPFVFAKAGFWIGFAFLVFTGAITLLFNLLFAELMLRTPGVHQLPGIAGAHLGPWAKFVVLLCNLVGIYGALLTYIIYEGGFLHSILSNIWSLKPELYSILFVAILTPFILMRLRTTAGIELGLAGLFIAVMLIIFIAGVPHITLANLISVTPEMWFLPYGVLLFAFAGLTAVPLQRQLLRGRERLFKPAILTAVVGTGVLYLLFAFTVVGVSGDTTTPDVFQGLAGLISPTVIYLGTIFGIMTICSSFLMLSTALFEIFTLDYGMRIRWAWVLTVLPPVLLYLANLRNPIDVISLVGAVAIGLESVIFIIAFIRSRRGGGLHPDHHVQVPHWLLYLMAVLFAAGVVYHFLQ